MAERGWPRYTAQVNDLVGGYIVTTYPYPLSAHDNRPDGDPLKCGYVVAQCMAQGDALVIAGRLNDYHYMPTDAYAHPERWRWVQAGYLEGTQRDG